LPISKGPLQLALGDLLQATALLILLFSKTETSVNSRVERCRIAAVVVLLFAQKHLAYLGKADPKLCFALDVFGGAAHAAPSTYKQRLWAIVADNEDWLNDALIFFGRATDWFDICKTLECLIEKFGAGKQKNFLTLNWADKDEIERLKRTANWVARHARRKFQRPPNPMELPEARRLVGQLLRRALEETAGPRQ
jgi:hypothetical protein